MKLGLVATAFFILIIPGFILAKDLGVYGAVYPIVEPDMLSAIHKKLVSMQKSGQLAQARKDFISRSVSHILRPKPVSDVTDLGDAKPTKHLFNPSIVLDKNITNATGNIIAKKGTRINPLTIKSFDEALLFIDGDNSKQIQLASVELKKLARKYRSIKIILVNGNINDTAKVLKHRIYFDQFGVLCHRFDIKHTPTLVTQAMVNGLRIPRLSIVELADA